MEASGFLSVQNHPYSTSSSRRMPNPRCQVDYGSLGSANRRFTILLERCAIDVLKMTQIVKGAMTILRFKCDCRCHIIERAVARGKARKEPSPLPRIGIDEKAFAKGHRYVSMIYELDNSTVEAIHEGRDTDAALACFSQLSDIQIKSVEAITVDIRAAYAKATTQAIPLAEAKIAHDPFHVMKMANEALDKVRKLKHRKLLQGGDTTLSGSKYLWLTGIENHNESQTARFESICSLRLATGRAWSYKELLRDLWRQPDAKRATGFLQRLIPASNPDRLSNIVTYYTHWITNEVAEGLNSKIMSITRQAGHHRNIENFRKSIFFYCSELNPYPR